MGESVSTESQPPKLCSWILFPYALPVKGKSGAKFFGCNCLGLVHLRNAAIFGRFWPDRGKTFNLRLRISLQPAQNRRLIVRSRCSVIMASASGAALAAPPRSTRNPPTPRPATTQKTSSIPIENEGVDYQIADVVAPRGDVLLQRDIGAVLHLREQPFGHIRVDRLQPPPPPRARFAWPSRPGIF